LTAILVVPLLLAACGDSGSPGGLDPKLKNLALPKIGPNEPFPALSTSVFDALSAEVPELAKRREMVLATEREAIKGALDHMRAKPKPKAARKKVGAAMPEPARFQMLPLASWPKMDMAAVSATGAGNDYRPALLTGRLFNLIPVAVAADPTFSGLGALQQYIVGNNVAMMMGEGISNLDIAKGGKKSVEMPGEKSGTVDASMTFSSADGGSVTAELITKVSMPIFGLDANSKVSITGDLCPSPDGTVKIIMKSSSNGRAGSAGSVIYDQNFEANITATVGDDAEVVNVNFDLKQATRSTPGGRQVYVESSQSVGLPGGEHSKGNYGEVKINRASSQATAEDVQASQKGLTSAHFLAVSAFEHAKSFWQRGNCIKIAATSPGNVAPGATSKIPVAVKHKKDGSSVPAKVTAQLSGGASVDPGVIAKAPGDLTHVASKEKQAKMTIALKATSRRGADQASLDINTNVAAAYRIVGGLDDFQTNTAVCDIMKPFTLTGGGITMQVSGGLSGTYSYTGPFNANGTGTYTISLPDGLGKPGTMTGGGAGSVTGDKVYTNTGTERYKLTPLEPCS
jgi:hypothetical protein